MSTSIHIPSIHLRTASQGFGLVELMISMVLGLIVIGGVISVFLANQQTTSANQALGAVQDGSRIASEFLSRDIRDAGLTGCGNAGRVANVVNNNTTNWWANWNNALMGYDDASQDAAINTTPGVGQPIANTSSIQLIGVQGGGFSVNAQNATSATFTLNEITSTLQTGDIVMVCDPNHATIFQISNASSSNTTLVYNTGTVVSPGNCSKGMGYPTLCTTNGTPYVFSINAQIAQLFADDWYIGINGMGGQSLFRSAMTNVAGAVSAYPQEMVRNVTNMQIKYLVSPGTAFTTASNVGAANWGSVTAAQITLTVSVPIHPNNLATTTSVTRQFTDTVTLRNRVN